MARRKATDRHHGGLADAAETAASDPRIDTTDTRLESLEAQIGRVRQDEGFMTLLRAGVERDEDILDRLAE